MLDPWQYKLLISLGVIATALLIRWILIRVFINRLKSVKSRYVGRKVTTYLAYFAIFFTLVSIWIHEFESAATFLGLITAGLAIALKEPIANFFGWIYIVVTRPFEMGDRIQVLNQKGDVLDISFFEFTILEIGAWVDANQSTGRIIHIPNGKVFTNAVTNATQGFRHIWHEIPITITFESNWKKAKEMLLQIENERVKAYAENAQEQIDVAERRYNIQYNQLDPTVYTSVKENGVCLTLRYLSDPRQQRASEQIIWEEVLRQFAECDDIHFAYPTQRIQWNSE